MGVAPKGESAAFTTRLRYAYRYVRDARELRRQVGALSATFPIEDARSLRYYEPGGANLGPDRAVIRDALARVDDTDVVWDLDATWGAYTAYLGRVCEGVVTLAAPERGGHLRRVAARNEIDATVLARPARDCSEPRLAGVAEPTVVRVAGDRGADALARLPTSARLVYVTPGPMGDTRDVAGVAQRLAAQGYRVARVGPGGRTLRAER